MTRPLMWVGLTEETVFNPPGGMEGWRYYRIEYGGCNKKCLWEGQIWLPRHANAEMVEIMLRGMIKMENDTMYGNEEAKT